MNDNDLAGFKSLILSATTSEQKKEEDYYTILNNVFNQVSSVAKLMNYSISDDDIYDLIKDILVVSNDSYKVISAIGYHPWLDDKRSQIKWNHRDIYRYYLLHSKEWSIGAVSSIEKLSDIILDHIADPEENAFNKKGLVFGDIQSGKTANYTALINKGIDAGYKLIIILAGVHNDLRSQTQSRIDQEILGFDSASVDIEKIKIGVGEEISFVFDIDALTSSKVGGDSIKNFKRLDMTNKPIVVVVKKNTTVLNNLSDLLDKNLTIEKDTKLSIPTLIIDDEVDQASINTSKAQNNPSTINSWIRKIINKFHRISYVGYTATPYANVFINYDPENGDLDEEDLFPKDFIIALPTPKDYCGVKEFFGDKENPNNELIRIIYDDDKLVNSKKDNETNRIMFKPTTEITQLNDSIKDAIDDYIISSAVKRARFGKCHNGLMIHLTAYKNPTTCLRDLIDDYVIELKTKLKFDISEEDRYKKIWEDRFRDISKKHGYDDKWDDIKNELYTVLEMTICKLLNGSSKDVIDYLHKVESQIIAIGGNKLSRGITIEGLNISYYLRTPNAYDTALQMGRWFGYKKKYIDLCRIYSKQQMINDFIHISDANLELREDIMSMNDKDLCPATFGLKIKSHPKMKPTSGSKMRSSKLLKVSFGEQREETTRFESSKIQDNINITSKFINTLTKKYSYEDEDNKRIYRDVKVDDVLKYLDGYTFPEDDGIDKTKQWIEYIKKLKNDNELVDWTIVINSLQKGNPDKAMSLDDLIVYKGYRTIMSDDKNRVRAITGKGDFKYFFSKTNDKENREKYDGGYEKGNEELRELFSKDKAFMVLYPLDLVDDNGTACLENAIGIGIWFPCTNNSKCVDYYVNPIYLYEEDDDEEDDDEE